MADRRPPRNPLHVLYIILIVAGFLAFVAYVRAQQGRRIARLRAELKAQWGKPRPGERDMRLVTPYHEALRERRSRRSLDGRSWRDLDLDAVFAWMDRCLTPIGRQALYDRLRSLDHTTPTLADFDGLVETLRGDEPLRLDIQTASPGPATSRNAIALLAVLGAPPAVVDEARSRAERTES